MKPTPCPFPKLQVSLLMLFLAAASINLSAQVAARPSRGATLFAANCASCHGSDATGDTSIGKALGAANLHSLGVQNLSDADLKKIIAAGKGSMPSFAGRLNDADLTQLVAHLREIGNCTYAASSPSCQQCARQRAAHRRCNSTPD